MSQVFTLFGEGGGGGGGGGGGRSLLILKYLVKILPTLIWPSLVYISDKHRTFVRPSNSILTDNCLSVMAFHRLDGRTIMFLMYSMPAKSKYDLYFRMCQRFFLRALISQKCTTLSQKDFACFGKLYRICGKH